MDGEEARERRAVVLVIDACGIGALPDAALYGDEGTNTLAHLAQAAGGLQLPTLGALGLGSIVPLAGVPAAEHPAIHGRLHALGPGKDSTAGHWELMGVVLQEPLPTYPEGFPPEVLARLEAAMGHAVICNRPYNGIAAIEDFAVEHLRTGALILYTSQDSVLQLAAHVQRVSLEELYAACAAARAVMDGPHAVGRVIARPFAGEEGAFRRTEGRRDFALPPPGRSYLQELQDAGVPVHGVGKINDLFSGVGVSEPHPGSNNARALQSTRELIDGLREGLIFVNLVETDQVYGHRKDIEGFHEALREIDAEIASWLPRLRAGDLLVVTADHGVDPAHAGTDHTREHVPLLAITGEMVRARGGDTLGAGETLGASAGRTPGAAASRTPGASAGTTRGARHDGPMSDVGASVLRWLGGREAPALPGHSFLS